MISINYRDARPIYVQIKDGFRRLILSGALENGHKLPSVRELASELAINPNTIQRAYRELESEGFVSSLAGKGSFVSYEKNDRSEELKQLSEQFSRCAEQLLSLGASANELISAVLDADGRRKSHD